MLHPIQELPKSIINKIKVETKIALLKRAMRDKAGTRPQDWIFREIHFGSAPTAPLWDDLTYLTEANAGMVQCMIDAGDLTAGNLSSFLAAAEKVPNDVYLGFYGFFDKNPSFTEIVIDGANQSGGRGALSHLRFIKGASNLDIWSVKQCYAYADGVCGLSDRPVLYDEKDSIKIEACFTEDTIDKNVGLRGYACEPAGTHINPDDPFINNNIDNSNIGKGLPIYGGVDPANELALGEIHEIKTRARNQLRKIAVDKGIVKSVEQAKRDLVIRELIAGDTSDATDAIVDLDQSATAQTTGQQNWAQDSSALTAGDLASVLAANQRVNTKKAIAIIGFTDYTQLPDLLNLSLETGGKTKDMFQVEHCYYQPGVVSGFFKRIVYYGPDDYIDFKMAFKSGAGDRFVQLRGYVIEKFSDTISA